MRRWVVLLLASAVLAGCADRGPKRYHISGKATWANKPIVKGQIFFEPDLAKGNDGPGGYADIDNGQYDTRASNKGTVGGPHTVKILGFDGKPGNELPLGNLLFEHVFAVDLPKEATTKDFDVPAKARRQ